MSAPNPLGYNSAMLNTIAELPAYRSFAEKLLAEDERQAIIDYLAEHPFQAALDLSVDHGLQIRDALILSVAAESHCRLLLSEDMQSGFTWRGVTVLNPFVSAQHPLLAGLLQVA